MLQKKMRMRFKQNGTVSLNPFPVAYISAQIKDSNEEKCITTQQTQEEEINA